MIALSEASSDAGYDNSYSCSYKEIPCLHNYILTLFDGKNMSNLMIIFCLLEFALSSLASWLIEGKRDALREPKRASRASQVLLLLV